MDTVAAGFALMLAAVAISHYQIMCHLRNYTEPLFQVRCFRARGDGGGHKRARGMDAPTPGSPSLSLPLSASLELARRSKPNQHPTNKQRYIIRILYMVPVYAVGSWCSLKWHAGGIYFDTIRDW